jgi:hypothetical protein
MELPQGPLMCVTFWAISGSNLASSARSAVRRDMGPALTMWWSCNMEAKLSQHQCRDGAPLLGLRRRLPYRLLAVRSRAKTCRPAPLRIRQSRIVCHAAAVLSLDAEDDPRAYLEGSSKTRPPRLPEPPKGTSLFAVLPYLCKLATADRCAVWSRSDNTDPNSHDDIPILSNLSAFAGNCGGALGELRCLCWLPRPQVCPLSATIDNRVSQDAETKPYSYYLHAIARGLVR